MRDGDPTPERWVESPGADASLREMIRAAEEDLPAVNVDRIMAGLPGGGGGGGPAAGGAASGIRPTTWAAVAATSLAAGAFLAWMTRPASPEAPPAAPPVQEAPLASAVPAPPSTPASAEPAAVASPPRSPPASTEHAPPRRSEARPGLPAADPVGEGTLLLRARTALARGDTAAALDAVDTHQRRYPRGRLSPEREAIAVDVLRTAGRSAAAQARARGLLRRWPDSPYAQGARDALEPDG